MCITYSTRRQNIRKLSVFHFILSTLFPLCPFMSMLMPLLLFMSHWPHHKFSKQLFLKKSLSSLLQPLFGFFILLSKAFLISPFIDTEPLKFDISEPVLHNFYLHPILQCLYDSWKLLRFSREPIISPLETKHLLSMFCFHLIFLWSYLIIITKNIQIRYFRHEFWLEPRMGTEHFFTDFFIPSIPFSTFRGSS